MSETNEKKPEQGPMKAKNDKRVRIGLSVSKEVHKKLRIYAINNEDRNLVVTIEDILEKFLGLSNTPIAQTIKGIIQRYIEYENSKADNLLMLTILSLLDSDEAEKKSEK